MINDSVYQSLHAFSKDDPHLHFRHIAPLAFPYVFAALWQSNISFLVVRVAIVNLQKNLLVFLKDFVYFYVVALESAELIAVHKLGIREYVFG